MNLPEDVREQAARLIVQDFRGRMKPLDTLARETAIKVTKKTTFEGRHPIDLFFGLVAHPQAWYNYPAIVVKNPGVQELLGVSAVTHVSLASLLQGGGYSLQAEVERAHRTSANQRDKTQQKLIGFDERVHILYGALQGHELRIFPHARTTPSTSGRSCPTCSRALGDDDPRAAEFQVAGDALFGGPGRARHGAGASGAAT